MSARLILNADDFGLTRGINRAIEELSNAGALTSATLMATAPAFDHAIEVASRCPTLGVGCHVVLVDGLPAAPPQTIPTLLGRDRKTFRASLGALVNCILRGKIAESEIALEAEAQIRKLQAAGIRVTHVDTHKHAHALPQVASPLLLAAQRCGVHAIRKPFEPTWSVAANSSSRIRRAQLHLLRSLAPRFGALVARHPEVATTQGTLGIAATGSLDASALARLFAALARCAHDGTVYELVCHPGYNDDDLARVTTRLRTQRDVERNALLTQVAEALRQPNPPRLVHFGGITGPSGG